MARTWEGHKLPRASTSRASWSATGHRARAGPWCAWAASSLAKLCSKPGDPRDLPASSFEERAVLVELHLGLGVLRIHVHELLGHSFCDHQVAIPLVIRGHHVPWGPLRVAPCERLVVGR